MVVQPLTFHHIKVPGVCPDKTDLDLAAFYEFHHIKVPGVCPDLQMI
ncbi:Uncharacterized protein dnm_041890 [Desulfonema magnum]|uniref:Uncharacterized protein n=1 Tax=Desulfonema magnum TaxID=45655 RepID=A0A975BN99_9BACT|nr:Uncharacterized protein dnm_041890 [Desulfonema magnum]